MEVKDLRIGNWVMFPGGAYYQVAILYKDYGSLKMWKKIPITKELLLKLGGYIHIGWDDMEFIRFDEFSSDMFELEIIDNKFIYDAGEIEFLHDLQNCYYFHNNRKVELEINL